MEWKWKYIWRGTLVILMLFLGVGSKLGYSFGIEWAFLWFGLVGLYAVWTHIEKHGSMWKCVCKCSCNSNTVNLHPELQNEGTVQPNSFVQTPNIHPSRSFSEQTNNEPRNNTDPTQYLGSFIQNSINTASEVSQRIMPNLQTSQETNNQRGEERNRGITSEVTSNIEISETNENESTAPNRTPTNIMVNLGYFMQNSLNSASEVSQTLMENYGLTNRQTVRRASEQSLPNIIDELTDSLPNTINVLEIPDVVINIDPAEPGSSDSALLPPSYDEVINNEKELNFQPPTYSESLRLSKSWIT